MLIRILANNPGCVYEIGSLIRVSDKQGLQIISKGYGEQVPESEVIKPPKPRVPLRQRSDPKPPVSTHMDPPRYICKCGFVAKDAKSLAEHQKGC